MKSIITRVLLAAICLISYTYTNAQSKYYASILDSDRNLLARGLFIQASDSGIALEIEKDMVFVSISNIYTIQIEKNKVKLEFIKLGVSATTGIISEVTDRSKKDSSLTPVKENDFKKPLLENLQELANKLLDKNNLIASIKIEGKEENFKSMLLILQQYSFEIETTTIVLPGSSNKENTIAEKSIKNESNKFKPKATAPKISSNTNPNPLNMQSPAFKNNTTKQLTMINKKL